MRFLHFENGFSLLMSYCNLCQKCILHAYNHNTILSLMSMSQVVWSHTGWCLGTNICLCLAKIFDLLMPYLAHFGKICNLKQSKKKVDINESTNVLPTPPPWNIISLILECKCSGDDHMTFKFELFRYLCKRYCGIKKFGHSQVKSFVPLNFIIAVNLITYIMLLSYVLSLTRPTDLSEPVDVYSDWIDACESANQ